MGIICNMKFIIPAKTGSTRCKDKNWRPFHGERSLVDVLIEKLLRVTDAEDIWVSVDGSAGRGARLPPFVEHNLGFLIRPDHLAHNTTPMSEVVRWHAENIPGDDDIAWCQCINPLFDEYAEVLSEWENIKATEWLPSDCLSVRYLIRGIVLDSFGNPIGMGFGAWAKSTQDLPPCYRYTCTLNIVSRETAIKHGYMGTRPLWYEAAGPFIDIKTDADFEAAQVLYAAKMKAAA